MKPDLPLPEPEEQSGSKFPHAAQFAKDAKNLPWPDWTGEALRFEFTGIKTGGSELDEQGNPVYMISPENQSDFRPDYWVIGRIMDQEDYEFMENYLSWAELGTSDTQVALNKLKEKPLNADRDRLGAKTGQRAISEIEPKALNYEEEQRDYFNIVGDGYAEVLSILNWVKVLDESKRLGIEVEEHPEFEDYSLEGLIIDTRDISEKINDHVQDNLILKSVQDDPTGLSLLKLREDVIRSRLVEEGENPDTHPWLVGFQQGKQRYEQLAHYLLSQEDMMG